ncbi:hypothetical protein Pla86_44740 [Planctomycetes bacterium Pla86]|uniref:Uncharacterized protein n=1 Tax=Engelhardtia mirabilis TaxID=2528011 RepID=A0A518BQV1_9BACT|nr:hypothetical protein Pla133_44760 [Planctomycetes bacterium Pla133]QDV03683.1 hypothetical protein Pla86_44740 [Planctomycetes bacterium Pla86]
MPAVVTAFAAREVVSASSATATLSRPFRLGVFGHAYLAAALPKSTPTSTGGVISPLPAV